MTVPFNQGRRLGAAGRCRSVNQGDSAVSRFRSQFSGLLLWLRADQGLTLATGVSQWNDLSGNGNHFSQPTGTKQFSVTASAINGKPALASDGVDDFMASQAPIAWGTFTKFLVFAGSTAGMVMEHGTGGANNDYLFSQATHTTVVSRSGATSDKATITSLTWGSDSIFRRVRVSFDGTDAGNLFALNDVAQTLVAGGSGSADPGLAPVSQTTYLMSRAGTSLFQAGQLAEVIVGQFSAAEVTLIESYLSTRYAL